MVWITCGPGRRFSVIDRARTPGRQLPSGAVSLRPGAQGASRAHEHRIPREMTRTAESQNRRSQWVQGHDHSYA